MFKRAHPRVAIEDYLRSNDYILPMYTALIEGCANAGGYPNIPSAILSVREEYLDAAFDEMKLKYGNIENYFSEGLNISVEQQAALKNLYLKN